MLSKDHHLVEYHFKSSIFIQVRSLPCLVCQSVSESLLVFYFVQIVGFFVKIDTWISLSLLHGFVKIATCFFSKFLHEFVKIDIYMDLHNLALQNKTNV